MKDRYVIYFTGIFESGYVRLSWVKKSRDVGFKTPREAKDFASKFYVKMFANFWCWMLNKGDKRLREYKVLTV